MSGGAILTPTIEDIATMMGAAAAASGMTLAVRNAWLKSQRDNRIKQLEASDNLLDATSDVVKLLRTELGEVYKKVAALEAEVIRMQGLVDKLAQERDLWKQRAIQAGWSKEE